MKNKLSSKSSVSIIIVFLLLFVSILTSVNATPQEDLPYTDPGEFSITPDGKHAYINNDKAFIMAPAEIHGSGWTYLNFTAKQYTDDIDLALGFDTTHLKPKVAEFYNPHYDNYTLDYAIYNVTGVFYERSIELLDIGNEYNFYNGKHWVVEYYQPNYNYSECDPMFDNNCIPDNYTTETLVVAFDSISPSPPIIEGNNYTITYHNKRVENWVDITDRFSVLPESIHNNYDGKNKWYYVKDQPITAGTEYQIRIDVDASPQLGDHTYKYDVVIKPSSQSFATANSNGNLFILDPYWNTSFSNRLPITITTNGTSTPANYQVLLNISYESEIQTDFDDIRFTNSAHGEIAYWIESKVDSNYANVWVNLSDAITDPGSDTIWMYYGNADVSDGGNIGDTFDFGDDFPGSSLDTDKWDTTDIANLVTTVTGGELRVQCATSDGKIYSKNKQYGSPKAARFKWKGWVTAHGLIETGFRNNDANKDMAVWVARNDIAQWRTDTRNENVGTSSAEGTTGSGTYQTWDIFWTSSSEVKYYREGALQQTTTTNVPDESNLHFGMYASDQGAGGEADGYFDWVFVREYIANEPITSYNVAQHYTDSLHYNATSNYNHTIWSDGTITSNRSIITADDTNDTVQSTGTSYLTINVFDNDAIIVRNFTFARDNLDWYQAANLSGSYDLKNSSGIIETQSNGNFTTNLIAGTYWIEEIAVPYKPPIPTSLANTTGNFWVNYTWSAGSGNVTDSYNVSYNGTWDNSSLNDYRNESVGAHGYLEIIVYAYNNTGDALSVSSITDNVTVSNNAITITNTSDWSDNEGQNVYVDYDATDVDSDTPTFSCNRTDLFTDFSTSTGIGNWQTDYTDSGVFSVNFGVEDGYSSTSNYTMTITVADYGTPGTPTGLTNTTGNFWVNYTWSTGANTDTFNVSYNDTWDNTSSNTYRNESVGAHGYLDIVVYAYNSTSDQVSSSITDNVTISNNAITISGVSTSYTINEGETLSIDANYTDADGDTPTFNDNSTDWNVDSSTGVVSWVTSDGDDGTYTWYINVSDGYGSTDQYNFTVMVNDSIEPVYFTNIAGVYHFWNYTNIPELYIAINNNSVLSHNATTNIYTMHYPFYQNNSGDTFNFNESVHLKSNNDGGPSYFRWAGNVEFDYYTILGWNTTSNVTAPTTDTTRAYVYCDDGATGNITNGEMSYLGYNSVGKYGIKLDDFDSGTIFNNTFSYNFYGLHIGAGSEDNTINSNFIHSNTRGGVIIGDSAHFCSLSNNDIWSNGEHGIYLVDSNNVNFTENNIQLNGEHGIKLAVSTHATFTNNVIDDTSSGYYDYRLESGSTNAIFINAVKASNYYSSQLGCSPFTFQNGVDYDITLTEDSVIRDNPTAGSEALNMQVVSGTIGQMDVSSLIPSTSYDLEYTNGTLIESQTSDGSGDSTFTSDLTTGNYIITLRYAPTITLVSFSPTPINTNYTGATTISYMVNSSEPLNLSSLAFLHGVNYTIPAGGDMHNYLSVPANDISYDGWYKAPNRNVTPYLSWEFNDTITNGNVWQWGGGDNDSSWITKTQINATHTWINVTRMVPESLSNAYFIDSEALYDAPKTGFEINKAQGIILKGWDLDQIRNRNNDYFVSLFFDTSWESTVPTDPIEIGYCNNSYDPAVDDIDTCPDCIKFLEWNGTRWIDHSWNPSTNASYASPLVINAQYFTDPSPDDIAYVWLRSNTVSSKSYILNATDYDPGLTNITFAETESMWTYNEQNGVTTPAAYTPSYFAMYTRDDEDLLHHLYIANDQGVWGHSAIFSESIGVSSVPVPPVSFEYFNVTCDESYHDEEMDATYDQGTIGVGLHTPADPDGGIVSHNLTLHYYPNQTIVAVINNTFTTTGDEYVEITVDTTPYYSPDTLYTFKCVSTDDEGSVATKWLISYFALDADGNRGWVMDDQLLFWGMNDIPTLYTEVGNSSLISYNGGSDIYTMHVPFFKSKGNDTFYFNETVHLESLNNEDVAYFRHLGRTYFDYANIYAWNTTTDTAAPDTDTYRSYIYSLTMICGNITNSNFSYLGSDFYRQEGLNFVGNSHDYLIHNSTFSHNVEGPIFEECENFTISNSIISNNVNVGVGVYFTNNTIVENSTISSNGGRGVSVYEGNDNIIRYNDIINSGVHGIHLWSNSQNNTCTGNDITGSTTYDYYLSSSSTDNYIIDPASSTDKIRVTSTSSLNIENTNNAAFSEDSLNTSYAYLTNFSMYVTGVSQTFDITQHNAIITPSTDKLSIWNLEWDDTLTFNVSSDTAINPTWFNITNTSWTSSIVNVSINGTLVTTENTDVNGLLTYNYTDTYSEKWFEFQLYSSIPTPTPTPTVTTPPSGGSSSGTGTTGVGTSDEPLYNIDCRETGRIRNLQAGTETYYRTTKPDCTDIIKVTFTPTQNSPEQPILIEKLHNISRFVTTPAPGITYSNFNLYVGLFGFDEKTTNEKILFKVSKDWATTNNVTPESVTLYIFEPSTTSWKSLPTTLSHTDTLYYVYESESGATYGRFAIVGTDKVSLNIIEILTEKIEDCTNTINETISNFKSGGTSLYDKYVAPHWDKFVTSVTSLSDKVKTNITSLSDTLINIFHPNNISVNSLLSIFDNEKVNAYMMAILTIILIAIISYFYNYEHGLIAGILAIITIILVTILQDTALIKIMSVEAGNIIVSTVAYTTIAFIISYIIGEKLK